jgi:tellurite resistance protein
MNPPPASAPIAGWIAHLPAAQFAMIMGIGGLGLAWRKAAEGLGASALIGEAILALAALLFALILVGYLAKAVRHPKAVAAEFAHPVRSNFFATFSISLMILASALFPYAPQPAHGLWALGAALQMGLTLRLMSRWVLAPHEYAHFNPGWFVPVVGNIIAPVLGVTLGHAEIAWFFFSVGLVFWLVLFAALFERLVFHPPLPARLAPSLFILIAPPAVGFIGYQPLAGHTLDVLARILFFTALFITLLVLLCWPLWRKLPFGVTWWAFTFPLDAMALASLDYASLIGHTAAHWLAGLCLGLASLAVLRVFLYSAREMIKGDLFPPE